MIAHDSVWENELEERLDALHKRQLEERKSGH